MLIESSHQRITYLKIFWENTIPNIQKYEYESDTVTKETLIGNNLSYQVISPIQKLCINYGEASANKKFPNCEKYALNGKRCASCTKDENIFAAQFHNVHTRESQLTSTKILKQMQQPNLLYLAAFYDGSIKVGTSSSSRIETRLLEQGAICASVLVETPDGITIRVLEDLITDELGVSQAISTKKKIDGLLNPVEKKTVLAKLAIMAGKAQQSIESSGIKDFEKINTIWENDYAYEKCWQRIQKYPNSLAIGSHDFRVVSLIGRVAALTHSSGMTLLADLDEILGLALEVGEFSGDELSVQEKLF